MLGNISKNGVKRKNVVIKKTTTNKTDLMEYMQLDNSSLYNHMLYSDLDL